MSYIPNLTKLPIHLLSELFLSDNPEWADYQILYSEPEPLVAGGVESKFRVTIPDAGCDVNGADITYRRISLVKLFERVQCGVLNTNFTDGNTDIATIKDEILQQYGVNISDGFTVVKEHDRCYLTAKANNYAYVHRVELVPIPTLRERVALTVLDGFELITVKQWFRFKIGLWTYQGRQKIGFNSSETYQDTGGGVSAADIWAVNNNTLAYIKSLYYHMTYNIIHFMSKTKDKWMGRDDITLTFTDDSETPANPPISIQVQFDGNMYVSHSSSSVGVLNWLKKYNGKWVRVDVS